MVQPSPPSLPVWEQTAYWLFGVGAILYGIYRLHLTSMDLQPKLQYMETGWDIFGGVKDGADYEWHVYSTYLCWRIAPLLLLHLAVRRCLAVLHAKDTTDKLSVVVVGMVSVSYLQSWRFLLMLLATPVAFHLVSSLHSLPAVWTLALALLHVLNCHVQLVINMLHISTSTDMFVVVYIWASVFLRCTCFSIERVWSAKEDIVGTSVVQDRPLETQLFTHERSSLQKRRSKIINYVKRRNIDPFSCSSLHMQNGSSGVKSLRSIYGWPVLPKVPDFVDFLVYVFYVPLLLCGPPVPYKAFKEQLDSPVPLSQTLVVSVLWGLCRVAFWFCFNNVMLHFLFFQAFGQTVEAIQTADKWTLASTAYLIGQFMTNKYVVIYGMVTQTARLDGLHLPANPACISYIYAYSDMWKSFDRGLHTCMKRYIYIPLGGSQAGWLRTQLSTLATFLFIGYWHGAGYRYMTWAVLNFVEVNLELLGGLLARSPFLYRHVVSRLSAAGESRLRAVLSYPVFLVATTSNMVFLAGLPFAMLYLHTVCLQWDSCLTLGLVTYCMTHNSKHLQRLGYTKCHDISLVQS